MPPCQPFTWGPGIGFRSSYFTANILLTEWSLRHIFFFNVFKHCIYLFIYVYVWVHMCHSACVKTRGQLLGVGHLYPPFGYLGSNSGRQTWHLVLLLQPSLQIFQVGTLTIAPRGMCYNKVRKPGLGQASNLQKFPRLGAGRVSVNSGHLGLKYSRAPLVLYRSDGRLG